MTTDLSSTRGYDSSGRRARAEESRQRILQEATELFVAHGYARTTIAAVASAAAVSAPTVNGAFGGKSGLLRRCVEVALAGDDDERSVSDRPLAQWVYDTGDPRELLGRYAVMIATMARRAGPIYDVLVRAADADPDLAALLTEFERQRLRASTMVADAVAALDGLAPGLTVDDARDIVWTFNAPELYVTLTRKRRWSQRRYQRYVHDALVKLLTEEDTAGEPLTFGQPDR